MRRRVEQRRRQALMSPAFSESIRLSERLAALDRHQSVDVSDDYGRERAKLIQHPYLTVGRERYERVAAALALEPRDPFLDRRVADFCVCLPGDQMLDAGWPKAVMRRALAGRLPEGVRWRRGKEHLGASFTSALVEKTRDRLLPLSRGPLDILAPYVESDMVSSVLRGHVRGSEPVGLERLYEVMHLAVWLSHHRERPVTMVEHKRLGQRTLSIVEGLD
jgi:asparagine synthase (glutamine-hydrolysing)